MAKTKGLELFPHQERLLETLSEYDQFAVFWSMRVMKTLPILLHVTNLIMSGEAKDALVIAPKSALGAWKRDINKTKGKRRERLVTRYASSIMRKCGVTRSTIDILMWWFWMKAIRSPIVPVSRVSSVCSTPLVASIDISSVAHL